MSVAIRVQQEQGTKLFLNNRSTPTAPKTTTTKTI